MFKRFFPALDAYETLPTVLFFGKASGNEELWSKSALDMDVSADAALAFERHFIQENGVANGDTTKRTEVFTRYQLSVKKSDRLSGTWTLGQYERMYTKAFYEAVREANPNWQHGQPFDTSIVRNITREDVEKRIVKGDSEFSLKPKPSLDIKV